ncbi:MAG: hypothetical protein HZA61_08490 [Candidatus Eisenbacteria bacterium]|uniref:Type II secretion system protein GspC N-terminal domain-containing protein n=1 Tax=Eiseniibacteriota bacterium TaxID=2212470 RepID=A0A933W910_UNCEI|nr:hypothetical protein [Candidatus Eisenbacteria bacterium]
MAGSPNFVAKLVEHVKRSVVNRVIALVAVLVLGGASYAIKMVTGGSHSQDAPAAATASATKPVQVANTAASAAPVEQPVTAEPAATEGGAAVVHAVTQDPVSQPAEPAHMEDHLTYQYNALGRRDPFQSLVEGDFVGADVGGDAPLDVGGIKIVGVVWGATDQFALAEDVRGNSFVLRKGDKVQNGYVEALRRDAVVVNLTAEGQTQSVVIPLVRKGDSNAR